MSDNGKSSGKSENPLFRAFASYTGAIASNLADVMKAGSAVPLMYSDNWLKDSLLKSAGPERLQAMADAGRFLKDAREVAGLNLRELSEALGLNNSDLLQEVEAGRATLPFDMILRIASLVARHDPIPLIIKFVRTYNPALEEKLEAWGLLQLPKQYERERRFVNLLRQYDSLRTMADDEFERFIGYQEEAVRYATAIMEKEKSEHESGKS